MSTKILKGDGTWNFVAEIIGDDIVVRSTTATWFGGDSDPLDNGETASGFKTKGNPLSIGCSLPMNLGTKLLATKGSPLPRLPWLTVVEVTRRDTGAKILAPLIDIGPAKRAGDAVDLTVAAFNALGASLKQGVIPVTFRILGGAKYV